MPRGRDRGGRFRRGLHDPGQPGNRFAAFWLVLHGLLLIWSAVTTHHRVTSLADRVALPPGIDTCRRANWAECGRPFSRREMMLENKVAVIYGAGGGIGSAVARAFVR